MGLRLRLLLTASALAAALAATFESAAAQEGELTTELRAADSLVDAEKWATGYDAFRSVLDAHPNDPRLLPHLLRIEREMQRCRFRSSVRQLKANDVLGPGATRLSTTSLQAEFKFDAPEPPLWRSGDGAHALEPVFVPPITLSFKASGLYDERNILHVIFAEATGVGTGIYVSPGCYSSSDDRTAGTTAPPKVQVDARIGLVVDGEVLERASRYPMAFTFENRITITVKDDETKLKCEGEILKAGVEAGPCRILIAAGDASDIRIKAKLEPEWANARLDDAWEKALGAWVEAKWMRSKHFPDWACRALELQREVSAFGGEDDIERQLTWARGVAPWSWGEDGKRDVPASDVSDRYLEALADLAAGRLASAEKALGDVLDRDPGIDRARVWRAWVRTELRQWNDATTDLVAIRPANVVLAPATLAAARIAVHRGKLDLAEEVLAHAVAESVAGPRVNSFLEAVRRIRRGPGFEGPQGAIRDRFRVIGSVSESRCIEVGEQLVGARLHSAQLVGDVSPDARQCTVFAFSSEKDMESFVSGIEGVVRAGRAAYLPHVPTVVLDASGAPSVWLADLRAVAWHEHLDRKTPSSVPAWLIEGGARLLRDGDPAVATPDPAVDPRAFIATAELLRVDAARVVPESPLAAQSRELVRFLATHEDPELRALPAKLIAALRGGASWQEVLEGGPLADLLARAAREFDTTR